MQPAPSGIRSDDFGESMTTDICTVYILVDILLTTDVNKYSVTTASCQQRWQTNWVHLDLFLGVEQRTLGCLGLPITTKQQSVVWLVSQSWRMLAFYLATVGGYTGL